MTSLKLVASVETAGGGCRYVLRDSSRNGRAGAMLRGSWRGGPAAMAERLGNHEAEVHGARQEASLGEFATGFGWTHTTGAPTGGANRCGHEKFGRSALQA